MAHNYNELFARITSSYRDGSISIFGYTLRTSKKALIFYCGAAILIAGFFYAYLYQDALYAVAWNLDLVPKAEALTELSLDNSTALPKTITPGQIISFSFTIHNLEGTDELYRYRVYGKIGGQEDVIDQNEVTLENGGSISIPESLRIGSIATEIFIELDTGEMLHFNLPSTE
jgi:hypothetical protein